LIKARKLTQDAVIASFGMENYPIVVSANCMRKTKTIGIVARTLSGPKI
jgi:hypothetical protein